MCEESEASWTGAGLVLGYRSNGFSFFFSSSAAPQSIKREGGREGEAAGGLDEGMGAEEGRGNDRTLC